MTIVPLFVVEGATAVVDDLAADLASVGWRVHRDVNGPRPGAVVVRTVASADDMRAAVLAAVGGTGLVVDARADRDDVDLLCADLRRLGTFEHLAGATSRPPLDAEQRRLLDLLADGLSLGQAAIVLHLSRRSTDRRLATARLALGAASTDAVVARRRERLARLPRPPGEHGAHA